MRWITISVVTVVLHYAWEMLQAPLFADFTSGPFLTRAMVCLAASFADLAIAATAYAATTALFRNPNWPLAPDWIRPTIFWISVGLAITLVGEIWATSSGWWRYGPAMPTFLGVGISPLAQWVLVPTTTLFLFRYMSFRSRGAQARDKGK